MVYVQGWIHTISPQIIPKIELVTSRHLVLKHVGTLLVYQKYQFSVMKIVPQEILLVMLLFPLICNFAAASRLPIFSLWYCSIFSSLWYSPIVPISASTILIMHMNHLRLTRLNFPSVYIPLEFLQLISSRTSISPSWRPYEWNIHLMISCKGPPYIFSLYF